MELIIKTEDQLDIPDDAFNEHSLAVLVAQGGRYGGDWIIGLTSIHDRQHRSCGKMSTLAGNKKSYLVGDVKYPSLAIESLFSWIKDQTSSKGWRVVYFASMNDHYTPSEAPYFCTAQIMVANSSFVPADGVMYADDIPVRQLIGRSCANLGNEYE